MTTMEALAKLETALLGRALNTQAAAHRVLAVLGELVNSSREDAWAAGAMAMRETIAAHWHTEELRVLADLEAVGGLPEGEGHGEKYVDVARGQSRARAMSTRAIPLPSYEPPAGPGGGGR